MTSCDVCGTFDRTTDHRWVHEFYYTRISPVGSSADAYAAARDSLHTHPGAGAGCPFCTAGSAAPACRPTPPPPVMSQQESAAHATGALNADMRRDLQAGPSASRSRVSAAAQRLRDKVAEKARLAKLEAGDVLFGLEQASKARAACAREQLATGRRCFDDVVNRGNAVELGVDLGLGRVAGGKGGAAGAAVVSVVKSVLKSENCEDYINEALTDSCGKRLLPEGYANIDTTSWEQKEKGR